MKKNNYSNKKEIGFTGLVTIVFIYLKLCGIIEWSWIWVLSPIWITVLFLIVIFVIVFIVRLSKVKGE